ncbi:MAG: thioredoxin family protein [Phycisphaerales bacterium]|jgi:protein disulfide-isomerase|nr:thioredoxin family protein [Phycisphaerales bacterium]
MSIKRMKHKGLFLATLLVAGLAVAALAVSNGSAACGGCKAKPAAKAACPGCKDGIKCAACKAKHAGKAHATLAGKLQVALDDLDLAAKAVEEGKKSEALKAIAKVKTALTGIRNRVKPAAPAARVVTGWTEDFDKAVKYAAATKRPLLLDFSGSDWCGWCIKLHNEVFVKDAFKTYADKNLVLVEVDFPRGKKQSAEVKARNSKLAAQYGVRGFPTVVILDSTGKKELGRTGYVKGGPEAFIAAVKNITGK